jgi:hypothetical protein
MKIDDVAQYVAMTEDDLYAEIADVTTGAGLLPEDRGERSKIGRNRFQAIQGFIVSKVCDPEVRKELNAERDETKLVIAIGDILSTLLTGLPLVLVSVLIAKIGLSSYCPKD